jgi:alcohol dehydrogenase
MAGEWGGAAADLVRVPYADAMLVPLPAGLAPRDAAAMSCNVVDAYRCVGPQLAARPGADVLIVAGAFANIALYCVAIARGLGAGRIDFVSHDSLLAARAQLLGARIVPAAELEPMRYPISVDASMDPSLLSAAVYATARAGVCTVSTMYASPEVRLPLFAMFERCITLHTGQPHARALLDQVLALWSGGKLDLAPVVDAVLDWEEAPQAFSAGRGKLVCVRN